MNSFDELGNIVLVYTFGLPRMLAAFALLPMFSRELMSGLVRNGLAVNLSLLLYPVIATEANVETLTVWSGTAIVFKEVVIGTLIGYGAATLFWAVESTGFFIDNQRGATMASSIDPLTGSQTSPLGVLFVQAITAVFFISGGFVLLMGALYHSYKIWPVFSFFPNLSLEAVPYFLKLADNLMALAVLLAAPVIIAMFLSEFALGLVSRFAPQLNVFFLAMPVKSAVGMLILVLYIGILLGYFGDELMKLAVQFRFLEALFVLE